MKNTIYVIVIALCLVLAVVIFVMTRGGGPSGIEAMERGEMTLVMCNNPACKATYEIDLKDYYTELQEKAQANPAIMSGTPPLTCKECGEESLFRAVKCEKCGHVFFYGNPADFDDRCPECGFSKIEDERRRRREARGG